MADRKIRLRCRSVPARAEDMLGIFVVDTAGRRTVVRCHGTDLRIAGAKGRGCRSGRRVSSAGC
jgi:hypothetical protein